MSASLCFQCRFSHLRRPPDFGARPTIGRLPRALRNIEAAGARSYTDAVRACFIPALAAMIAAPQSGCCARSQDAAGCAVRCGAPAFAKPACAQCEKCGLDACAHQNVHRRAAAGCAVLERLRDAQHAFPAHADGRSRPAARRYGRDPRLSITAFMRQDGEILPRAFLSRECRLSDACVDHEDIRADPLRHVRPRSRDRKSVV